MTRNEAEKGGEGASILYKEDNGDQDMGFGQAVELLSNIFASKNKKLIRAITSNLDAFNEAIENQNRAASAFEMMADMQSRMDKMERRLAKLSEIREPIPAPAAPFEDQLTERQLADEPELPDGTVKKTS